MNRMYVYHTCILCYTIILTGSLLPANKIKMCNSEMLQYCLWSLDASNQALAMVVIIFFIGYKLLMGRLLFTQNIHHYVF